MWMIWLATAMAFGGFGGYVATQKRRSAAEGFVIGGLLGPVGLIVVLLLPEGATVSGAGPHRNIDELGTIASIADQLRTALEEQYPDWERLPYHRKRALLRPLEKRITRELGLSATQGADLMAEARRLLFGTKSIDRDTGF